MYCTSCLRNLIVRLFLSFSVLPIVSCLIEFFLTFSALDLCSYSLLFRIYQVYLHRSRILSNIST